jgi:predicted nucleotidyltransferase
MMTNNDKHQIITPMDKRAAIREAINKVKDYKELINETSPIKIEEVYLFGSYAKGTFREHSDIDVALVVNHIEDDDYWTATTLFWKLTYRIDDRIEPHLIARDTDYSGFLDEIQRTGVEITK